MRAHAHATASAITAGASRRAAAHAAVGSNPSCIMSSTYRCWTYCFTWSRGFDSRRQLSALAGRATRLGGRSPTRLGGRSPTLGRSPLLSGRSPTRLGGRSLARLGGRSPTRLGGRSPTRLGGRSPTRLGGRSKPTRLGGRSPTRLDGRSKRPCRPLGGLDCRLGGRDGIEIEAQLGDLDPTGVEQHVDLLALIRTLPGSPERVPGWSAGLSASFLREGSRDVRRDGIRRTGRRAHVSKTSSSWSSAAGQSIRKNSRRRHG